MFKNHSSEQILKVSGAQNNNFLDSNPDRAIRALEEANGYDHDQVNRDEREAFVREVAELRHRLKALINHQQPLLGENESGENDNSPLLEMIKECSLFVKLASEERLQAEAIMREIHGVVLTKEQEIGDLNARVSELSVSNDVAASYNVTV